MQQIEKKDAESLSELTFEQLVSRTPGRKLSREDLASTSALILGCSCVQNCCGGATGPSGPEEPGGNRW